MSLFFRMFILVAISSCCCCESIRIPETLTADFTYSPAFPVPGQAVIFKDASTGSPASWQWDFGDAALGSTQNPAHSYATAGSYRVMLTVTAGSNSNSTSKTISITQANVITAASPSFSDVSAAVAAARAGDTVLVPAGSATWGGYLSITKGISIIGAGIGNTIITAGSSRIISFSPDATTRANQDLFRVSGFAFRGSTSSVIELAESDSQTVPIRNVRIDHNRWENSGGYPISVNGNFWGVVDSNQFAGTLSFIILGNQGTSWNQFYPATYGTADNLYFEDNTFEGSSWFYFNSGHGGRWAFRHNTSTTPNMGTPLFDQHGNQDGGIYALMLCEIYENRFTGFTTGVNRWNYQRGGKLLMYNNTGISSAASPQISVNDDVNSPAPPIQWPYDSYFFNNIWNGTRVNAIEGADAGNHIAENVTFWNQKDDFNGTVGVGVGPLSSRPTTCTTGVGYWATDTKTLYRATATNTWTVYYTPYTYPHPLRQP
jgi:PKD repeat protein